MAFNMLRFSFNNICIRSIMSCECDNRLLKSTFIQVKRFQHSESEKLGSLQTAVRISEQTVDRKSEQTVDRKSEQADVKKSEQTVVSISEQADVKKSEQTVVKKSERVQAIQFKKLIQDDIVIDRFSQKIKELMDNIENKPEGNRKVDDLTNIVLTAAKDVCGTSQKFLYKCDKCNDVFSKQSNLTNHQSACTGLISENHDKRKCDKCLRDIEKNYFNKHYISCQGLKANQLENKPLRANCPDCGQEMNKNKISRHKKKDCKGIQSWCTKDLVKCTKCGDFISTKGIDNHIKVCTGLQAADPNKRKCDKCLKEFLKPNFSKHYSICKGIIENKVNCPDCGKEMKTVSLKEHRKLYCRGGQSNIVAAKGDSLAANRDILGGNGATKISKESDQMSDTIIKVVEDNFRIKDNAWLNISEDEIQGMRSRVTRVIKVTEALPDLNTRNRGVCPDCGLEMGKYKIKKHQKLHCTQRKN